MSQFLRGFGFLSSQSTPLLLLLYQHSAGGLAEVLSACQASLLFWCSASRLEQQKIKIIFFKK